ncbi:MAG: hypothetical protein GF317_21760 [Candidatus Lokiarchaeota archaeon]|nr:hypothetical protein [Candidatus Lokiarchaeota archaeon]MBD3202088.1 hypothetical protein [Candidatus Lokiarchaeota archaeon]
MSQTKSEEVFLRSYPKVIFFWPLFLTSLVLWIIQLFMPAPEPVLGYFWVGMFFVNLFVIAFDFSSTKFFVLILIIVVGLLIVIFLVLPEIELSGIGGTTFNLALTQEFYLTMTLIFGLVLGIVIINAQFNYWKVERNEIYHKSGIFSSADRYPVQSLRIKKSIPDVFEFLFLRAGSMVLMPGRADEVIQLPTVLNVNKRSEEIDRLLSHVSVEPDELDQ